MQVVALKRWLAHSRRIRPCSTIVLHSSAGSTVQGALSTLNVRGLSYHYLISQRIETCRFGGERFELEPGDVVKCAPYQSVAYHAGKSIGPHGPWVNSYSVGICFINLNDGEDPISDRELAACRELILSLKTAMPSIRYLTSHRQISWPRKSDPRGVPVAGLAAETGLKYYWRKGVPEL